MERKFKRRLSKLADLLEADARKKKGIRFNLGMLGHVYNTSKQLSCGTQACAIGLAALSGKFARAGMRVSVNPSVFGGSSILVGYHDGKRIDWQWIEAAKKVFGLTLGQAQWLFISRAYEGSILGAEVERAVATRVRQIAAGIADIPEPYCSRTY